MMGMDEGSVAGGATVPPCEKSEEQWILQLCLRYSLLAALCLSISKEPLHASSLFDTFYGEPCRFMIQALCGFQPRSPCQA